MSSTAKFRIDPLEGSANYKAWSRVLKAVLIREDLWEIVDGQSKAPTPPAVASTDPTSIQLTTEANKTVEKTSGDWNRSARHAYAMLTLAITPEVGRHLEGIEDPHTMWIKLRELYAPKGRAARHMLLKEVVRASLDGSISVEAYINSIEKCSRGLANMGAAVPEWMLVSFLIFGLNESYNTLVTVLENLHTEDDLTFENAVAALMEESRRKELHEDPVALLSRAPKSANT
jgi:gag-polypeptide of LTR copia-type/Domain of unknown function (DUF4219)